MNFHTEEVLNWKINCKKGSWSNDNVVDAVCMSWYCWEHDIPVGSISTELNGNGRGRLDFGNCWKTGIVRVFLAGNEIAQASANTQSTVIEFDFNSGDELKIVEESIGIIQFNNFDVLSCTKGEAILTTLKEQD